MKPFDPIGLNPRRDQNGHSDTSLGDDDALPFAAADTVQDIQAFRLELARAEYEVFDHRNQSLQMTGHLR
ncbi:MAG TPA: hypothetical protein VGF34_17625 [Stellaceae bacterium]